MNRNYESPLADDPAHPEQMALDFRKCRAMVGKMLCRCQMAEAGEIIVAASSRAKAVRLAEKQYPGDLCVRVLN